MNFTVYKFLAAERDEKALVKRESCDIFTPNC